MLGEIRLKLGNVHPHEFLAAYGDSLHWISAQHGVDICITIDDNGDNSTVVITDHLAAAASSIADRIIGLEAQKLLKARRVRKPTPKRTARAVQQTAQRKKGNA